MALNSDSGWPDGCWLGQRGWKCFGRFLLCIVCLVGHPALRLIIPHRGTRQFDMVEVVVVSVGRGQLLQPVFFDNVYKKGHTHESPPVDVLLSFGLLKYYMRTWRCRSCSSGRCCSLRRFGICSRLRAMCI